MSISRIHKMNIEKWVNDSLYTTNAAKLKKRGYTYDSGYYYVKQDKKTVESNGNG